MNPSLFQTRFIINTGKGGVGKTTISAAIALAFARRGERVLHMQLGARDRLGPAFGLEPVGPDMVALTPNITAVNTTGRDAMREYALMTLKVKALYKAVFENRLVDRFLRIVPGMPELTMLGKAYYHEKERNESGLPRWDAIVIDAPATGHGMFLLQIPQVITSALGSGHMASEARAMLELLEDPRRTCINLITLAEDMPVNETLELHAQLQESFRIRTGFVIANGLYPRSLSAAERQLASDLSAMQPESDDIRRLLNIGLFREKRCDLQRAAMERLRQKMDASVIEIPFFFESDPGRPLLEKIAVHLNDAVQREEGRA